VAHRGTIEFETSRGSVALRFREAKAFQERLSQAPGGCPLERQIQLAIDDNTTVVIADHQTAAAVSVAAFPEYFRGLVPLERSEPEQVA
jgi:hypothetical protein